MVIEEYRIKKFSTNRVMAVSIRVLKSFKRDHRTFGMMVIMPLLFMLIFGIVLSGEVNNVPVRIDNQDVEFINFTTMKNISLGDELIEQLSSDNRIDLELGDYDAGVDMVETVDLVASIFISENFTRDVFTRGNTTLIIYIDSIKPQIKGTVYNAISEALQEIMGGRGVVIEEHIAFDGAEYTGLDVSIPSVMGYILTFLILLISVLTIIREDIGKTKLRLYTTPLTPVERILGYSLALVLFAMIETALVIFIAIFIFGTVIKGSLPLLFFVGFLYGVAHIFLAFFLSNFAKNELQSVQLAVLIAIPSLALSGMMVPIMSFPPAIAAISIFIPLTYGILAFEGIMLRGWGFKELWFEITLISVLAIVFFVLALLSSSDVSKD